MLIGTAELPVDLHERNWKLFAKDSGLNGHMVCEEAFTVMQGVEERFQYTFEHAGADQNRLSIIEKYLKEGSGGLYRLTSARPVLLCPPRRLQPAVPIPAVYGSKHIRGKME